jgi:hypothetical protein
MLRALPAALLIAASAAVAAEPVKIIVKETAGIRRFGYPVRAVVSLTEALAPGAGLRLSLDGKPVPAQFAVRGNGVVEIDFNVGNAPNQSREYVFEHGPAVETSQPGAGMKIEEADGEFRILHGPELAFVVRRDLQGLLRSVRTGTTDYVRADSAGLSVVAGGDAYVLGSAKGSPAVALKPTVVKAGPLVCTVRFAGDITLPGGKRIPATLELEIPRSKSWVQVTWTLADDDADVSGMRLELNLNLDGEPALVDFGAAGTVYARLRKGESAELLGGIAFGRFGVVPVERPWWRVSTGRTGALTPLVEQPKGQEQATVEGWAHVMDKTRCTAIAVERFSFDGAQDRIEISAEGRLRLARDFAPADRRPERGKKSWRFWLHFVDMPVHVGAATSPQSILFPPTVQVVR